MCINTNEQLNELRRSKYVQSNCNGIYKVVKQKLKNGETVLFSGTPCQVNALNAFLDEKLKKKLYLVEIVCHGVPSPKIWEYFIKGLCDKCERSIEDIKVIQFKYKDGEKYFWNHPGFRIEWMDGTEFVEYSNNTWYENGFLGNLYVRPSCHECNFKNLSTTADLTIGDFWGCEKLYPDFFDLNGVSVISVNSRKGNELFGKAQAHLNVLKITKDEAVKYNTRFIKSAKASTRRKRFWKKFNILFTRGQVNYDKIESLVNRCVHISWFENCLIAMKVILGKVKKMIFGRNRSS